MLDRAGGRVSAFTTRDYTAFTTRALDHYQTFAVELLGDVLLNSVLPEQAVERQKSVIQPRDRVGPRHALDSRRRATQVRRLARRARSREACAECPNDVARNSIESTSSTSTRSTTPPGARSSPPQATSITRTSRVRSKMPSGAWTRARNPWGRATPPRYTPSLRDRRAGSRAGLFHAGTSRRFATTIRVASGCTCCPRTSEAGSAHGSSASCANGADSSIRSLSEYQAYLDAGLLTISGATSPENLCEAIAWIQRRACRARVRIQRLRSGRRPRRRRAALFCPCSRGRRGAGPPEPGPDAGVLPRARAQPDDVVINGIRDVGPEHAQPAREGPTSATATTRASLGLVVSRCSRARLEDDTHQDSALECVRGALTPIRD